MNADQVENLGCTAGKVPTNSVKAAKAIKGDAGVTQVQC